jgi:hypothetical protein
MNPPSDGWDREEREALEELEHQVNALRARHSAVPPLELLRAARHDVLPPDLQEIAERQLSTDPWTRSLVEGMDANESSLGNDREDQLLAQIRARSRNLRPASSRPWRGVAFALAAAALVVLTVWIIRPAPPLAPPPSPPDSAETKPPAQKPPPPRWEPVLDKPEIALSLAALTWRGGGTDNELLSALKAPLDAFRQGDYSGADRAFATLEAQYPGAVEVFFYGGVARLFLGEPQRALPALRRASELADSTFAPRAAWYRAIAEQRTGNVAAARALLEPLCRGDKEFGERACRGISQIDASGGPDAR